MSPADRRPWWDGLPVTQKIIAFTAPPIIAIFGLTRLVFVRPSGFEFATLLALVLLGVVLCASTMRDFLRTRTRQTHGNPRFEITMRGYRRHDVDSYIASLERPHEDASPTSGTPHFVTVWRGYNPRQVNEYLAETRDDRRIGEGGDTIS
ncbi:hypothetical protein [Nonomuraea fuscirosea]|uniref:hypothetical protein n=1 Tax=Nonomuraea fuscirosea TaxID=1291556 RepID=UPI0033DFA83C